MQIFTVVIRRDGIRRGSGVDSAALRTIAPGPTRGNRSAEHPYERSALPAELRRQKRQPRSKPGRSNEWARSAPTAWLGSKRRTGAPHAGDRVGPRGVGEVPRDPEPVLEGAQQAVVG